MRKKQDQRRGYNRKINYKTRIAYCKCKSKSNNRRIESTGDVYAERTSRHCNKHEKVCIDRNRYKMLNKEDEI